jgi:50S ribosomal subunit-associated GTPase HflX
VRFSARHGDGTDELLSQIQAVVQALHPKRGYLIPHDRHDIVAHLHRNGIILEERYETEGVRILASVPEPAHAAAASFSVPQNHYANGR